MPLCQLLVVASNQRSLAGRNITPISVSIFTWHYLLYNVGDSLWNKNLEVVEAIRLRNRSVGLEDTPYSVPWLTESVHIVSIGS